MPIKKQSPPFTSFTAQRVEILQTVVYHLKQADASIENAWGVLATCPQLKWKAKEMIELRIKVRSKIMEVEADITYDEWELKDEEAAKTK